MQDRKTYADYCKENYGNGDFTKSLNTHIHNVNTLNEMKEISTRISNTSNGGEIGQLLSQQMTALGDLIVGERKTQFMEK
jgi:hypothetical protein